MRLALLGLLLGGCPVAQRRFADNLAEAACEKAEACDALGGVSLEDCLVTTAAQVERSVLTADCDYDATAARACITAIEEADCAAIAEGATALPDCEAACAGG